MASTNTKYIETDKLKYQVPGLQPPPNRLPPIQNQKSSEFPPIKEQQYISELPSIEKLQFNHFSPPIPPPQNQNLKLPPIPTISMRKKPFGGKISRRIIKSRNKRRRSMKSRNKRRRSMKSRNKRRSMKSRNKRT
jgi:hypothetical protein